MCDPGTTRQLLDACFDLGEVAVHQWQANIYTRTFLDTDYSGVSNDSEAGHCRLSTPISASATAATRNFNSTDLNGYADFNEVFPLFNWYVIETDTTRYKNTGTHVVYDAGGPADGIARWRSVPSERTAPKPCGSSAIAANMANTYEPNPLPADLSVPGAVYCAEAPIAAGHPLPTAPSPAIVTRTTPPAASIRRGSTPTDGRDSRARTTSSNSARSLSLHGENGGIHGHVVYASTRPFDDPQLLLQTSWEPLVPHVRINLYKEGVAADGITQTLTLVDHTDTTSFDDWAQGFRPDGIPNMNCPGQGTDTSTDA